MWGVARSADISDGVLSGEIAVVEVELSGQHLTVAAGHNQSMPAVRSEAYSGTSLIRTLLK